MNEQKFIEALQQKGWLQAIEEVKVPTDFWVKNFKNIPEQPAVRSALINHQDLEEYFIAFLAKRGWFDDDVSWASVSYTQKLSEDFIEKFKDELDWEFISLRQKLSESFIEKHADLVDWYHVSWRQDISNEFIERHKDKLDLSQIENNIHHK